MNTARGMLAWVLVSWLALVAGGVAAVGAPDEYATKVLFSLEYGWEPYEIGISPGPGEPGESNPPLSVGGITVPAEDLIYISDAVQHRVKRFNSRGELTLMVDKTVTRILDAPGQPDVEVPLTAPVPVVADPQGRFYAAGQVFDPDGAMQLSVRSKSGTILEARGTDLLRSQVAAAAAQGLLMYEGAEPHFVRQYCDRYGNVYVGLAPAPTEYNMTMVRFDSSLRFMQVVPGTSVGWDGRSYGGIPSSESDPNDRLRMWAHDATLEATVTLRPPRGTGTEHYDWSRNRWLYNGLCTLFDAVGDIYKVRATRLPRDQWIELLPDFTIHDAITIYKFDHKGNFLLKLELVGVPFDMGQPVAIDPAGNIYHLEYYEDHVDFVKEVLVAATASGTGDESVGLSVQSPKTPVLSLVSPSM